MAAGATPATRIADGQQHPQHRGVGADRHQQQRAERESGDGAEQAAQRVLAGAQVRSSAAPTARRARPRTSAARRSGRPRGPRARARRRRGGCCAATPSAARRARPRAPGRPTGVPGSPSGWRPSSRSTQLRRSAAAARSMLPATSETAKASSCARKLGSSEVRNSLICISDIDACPGRGRPDRTGSSCVASCSIRDRRGGELGQRVAQRLGVACGSVEQICAALENGGGRRPHGAGRAVHRQAVGLSRTTG